MFGVSPHGRAVCALSLPPPHFKTLARLHPYALVVVLLVCSTGLLFGGKSTPSVLDDPRPGYWLAQTKDIGVWWCESGWKIGRDRTMPQKPDRGSVKPVAVSAARGEYEPVQVILRPERDGELLSAEVTPLRARWGRTSPISVRIDEVAYVQVTHPTDTNCTAGWYPDPLPPLATQLKLRAGQNQPLWLTFHVPPDASPGNYTGTLKLKTTLGDVRVPLAVRVYPFALPAESHLRSAFGLGGNNRIKRYHQLTSQADEEAVFEKYLKNFAEHRISPYSFFDYARIDIRFVGEGTNKRAQVDFTKFDQAAAKWLDEHHFNSFRLPLRGMGGGTFHSRRLGELEGFQEGTPEHARLFKDYLSQVERHLRERGWLDKAYAYWFDEPDPKDYEFTTNGMNRIKAAAPGLKRLLTEQPEPGIEGTVDIWCALTSHWKPDVMRARRAAGEEIWWYICCVPKAPYVTEFIDHPGIEMRLWPWQSWQYGAQGILVWATLCWTSPTAYPEPQLQNPWEDPMSWKNGYGVPMGEKRPWGNGDGRFLYPPRRDPNKAQTPCLDGPINSVRWENLRDGMEDYEYFWLLKQEVERGAATKGETPAVKEARELLHVPEEISKDTTQFTTDPRLLLEHRERIAQMIQKLQKAR